MGFAVDGSRVAGMAFNGSKIAGLAFNGSLLWKSGPTYTAMYSTDWQEYSVGNNLRDQSNWAGATFNSGSQVNVFDAGSGDRQVRASSDRGNNTAWRTLEVPDRATMYVRAVFPLIEQATGAYCGVTFHHTDGSSRQFACIRWDGSGFRPYTGTFTGTTAGNVSVDQTGSPIVQPAEWVIEVRATATNEVQMWVNGTHVLTRDTSVYSSSHCGVSTWAAPNSACSSFEFGTWAS